MDVQTEQLMLRQLDAGERMLWSGPPAPGIRFPRGAAEHARQVRAV